MTEVTQDAPKPAPDTQESKPPQDGIAKAPTPEEIAAEESNGQKQDEGDRPQIEPLPTEQADPAEGLDVTSKGEPPSPNLALRTDGPTLSEFVAAGYPADKYPPRGYAAVPEPDAAEGEPGPITVDAAGKRIA